MKLSKIFESFINEESLDDYDINHPFYQFKDGYILGSNENIDPEYDDEKTLRRLLNNIKHESEPFKIAYDLAIRSKLSGKTPVASSNDILKLAKQMVSGFIKEADEEEPLSQPFHVYAARYQAARDAHEDGWSDAEDYADKVEYRITGLTKRYKDGIKSIFDDYKKRTPIRTSTQAARKEYEEGWDAFVDAFINKKIK
jgi:hypothetical protein